MEALDLTDIPVIDEHCHGFFLAQQPGDVMAWRRHFTESADESIWQEHVPSTLFYHRLMRELAEFFGCEATESALLEARSRYQSDDLIRAFLQAGNIEMLLIDRGYPAAELLLPDAEVGALSGCRMGAFLRLENLMQELIAKHDTLDGVVEALRAALADVRAQGYVGLKSIVAYRTGLDIRWWDQAEADASFAQARKEVDNQGHLRLQHKPLLDTLLHVTFTEAAKQALPVQFHTGYGDTDADMLLANPLHLRAVLEYQPYRGMRVVLLHECYPYTRQGGYLAAVYEHVYLDLSYGIPFLSYGEMVAFTRAALGVAPTSKLLYSSDAVGIPELHWISARDGRRILGQALGESVAYGDLTLSEAETAARAILHDNAVRLYRLS
ncbi:MAG TPA: amidohydrolase family protein [Ktedonobacterales bacterium]